MIVLANTHDFVYGKLSIIDISTKMQHYVKLQGPHVVDKPCNQGNASSERPKVALLPENVLWGRLCCHNGGLTS